MYPWSIIENGTRLACLGLTSKIITVLLVQGTSEVLVVAKSARVVRTNGGRD
jgi:hypothetical protein